MSHRAKRQSESGIDETEFAERRNAMVRQQLVPRGITDPRVLDAMNRVPREQFIGSDQQSVAYADCALPIDKGQTISQPYTVAYMCEALRLHGSEKVLEIGTGSGYAAAILGCLAREVYSVERHPELAETARQRLAALKMFNVHVVVGDGTLGLSDQAPFDAIIASAGGTILPRPYRQQVSVGGRIVIPLEDPAGSQTMWRFTRSITGWRQEDLGHFAFVPLVGQLGWSDEKPTES